MIPNSWQINKNWTLFLDRDGVLNEEKDGSYIFHPDELILYSGVAEKLIQLKPFFKRILVVTNQRGIGKGLMTENDLHQIHQSLQNQIAHSIERFYFAPDADTQAINRKPNIGMGLQAKEDFPDIDFSQSIMVGNNLSDVDFGKRLGMKTVLLETTQTYEALPPHTDVKFNHFVEFAEAVLKVVS